MSLSNGEHYMQVSKWLGRSAFTLTLDAYGDYISKDEGGKAAPLSRPVAQSASLTRKAAASACRQRGSGTAVADLAATRKVTFHDRDRTTGEPTPPSLLRSYGGFSGVI